MAKFKVNKKTNYTVLSNTPLRNKEMSLKSKGLLCLMLSLPEDWDYSISGLCAICKENYTAIQSSLNELKSFGYITVQKLYPNESGTGKIEYVYNIYDEPVSASKNTAEQPPLNEKQGLENLALENPALYINKDNKDTHRILSKDNILESQQHSQGSAGSTTNHSGKLVTAPKGKTRKSIVQKTNSFITACERQMNSKMFSAAVKEELMRYFRMLGELNTLLPEVSIAEQLKCIQQHEDSVKIQIIRETISHGWKNLKYASESVKQNSTPSWDTAEPGAFKAKTSQQKTEKPALPADKNRIF